MKKTIKRLFAVVLAALFIAVSFTDTAFAAKKTVKYYMWEKSKNYRYIDGNWVIDNEQEYSYKKNGDLKYDAYCYYNYDYETKVNEKGPLIKSVYSTKKKKTTTKHYSDGKYTGKSVYTSGSKKSTSKSYDANGKLYYSSVDTYDKHGNIIKSVSKVDGKTYTTKFKNTYKKGRLVKAVASGSEGSKSTSTYSYYSDGTTKKYTYKSDSNNYFYSYDKKGRITKYVSDSDYSKTETTYEYKGKKSITNKMTEKVTYKEDNRTETNIYTYKRKFDKNKNITEEITYKNGKEDHKSTYSGYKQYKYTIDDSKK